jgi:hypothetical protein
VIRKRRNGLQVQVYAGRDPLTGRKRWVSRQVPGQTKQSHREAKKVEAELLEQVDRGHHRGSSSRTVAQLIERRSTRLSGRAAGCTCTLAPAGTTRRDARRRSMAQVDPDQDAALRRLRAAYGSLEIVRALPGWVGRLSQVGGSGNGRSRATACRPAPPRSPPGAHPAPPPATQATSTPPSPAGPPAATARTRATPSPPRSPGPPCAPPPQYAPTAEQQPHRSSWRATTRGSGCRRAEVARTHHQPW